MDVVLRERNNPQLNSPAPTQSRKKKIKWRRLFVRIWDRLDNDNLSIVAAGVAFYGFLAIFPALTALVSIYGLVLDPPAVEEHINSVMSIIPSEARGVLSEQLKALVTTSGTALGLGLAISLLLTIWSATRGIKALIVALNIAYHEKEHRGFFKLNAIALAFTAGGILLIVFMLTLTAIIPAIMVAVGFPQSIETWVALVRWPIMAGAFIAGLGILYRYAPCHNGEPRPWLTWGAMVATVWFLMGSAAFSFFISNFADYNKTYGSVGAVAILLMWFYYTSFIILLGAELNAEIESKPVDQPHQNEVNAKPETASTKPISDK